MINFLIWTTELDNSSGGSIALHRLADLISSEGEACYVLSNKTTEGSLSKNLSDYNKDLDSGKITHENTMILYPEVAFGNPYGFPNVTRWLLNTPGVCGGDGIYGENDLIYKYYDYFKAPDESKVRGELRTFQLKLDKFYNKNLDRSGECYIVKKGKNKVLDKHDKDSLDIGSYINDDYLSDVFNRKKRFISYDSMCFHLQQASLCGCLPIVIPDKGVTKEEFIKKAPVNKYGVAYGFIDVEHARKTQHLLKGHLEDMEKESTELVRSYIKDCYDYMNIKK